MGTDFFVLPSTDIMGYGAAQQLVLGGKLPKSRRWCCEPCCWRLEDVWWVLLLHLAASATQIMAVGRKAAVLMSCESIAASLSQSVAF